VKVARIGSHRDTHGWRLSLGNSQPTHLLEGAEEALGGEQGVGACFLFTFGIQRLSPYKVQLSVAGHLLEMEADIWASLSVISEKIYNNLVSVGRAPSLEKSGIILRTYSEEEIKLNWPRIKQLSSHDKRLEEILQKHVQLFEEGGGILQGTKARIHVDPTVTPIFHKARPVPYALREKIEQDLERLERAGTTEPVQYSEWTNLLSPL